jgi:hypothetical protein
MNAAQLRDWLSEHIEYTFPDIPVLVAIGERVYEIGVIRASSHRVILEAGEEEALSKQWRELSEEAAGHGEGDDNRD